MRVCLRFVLALLLSACTGAGGCEGPGQPVSAHVSRASTVTNVVQARLSPEGFTFVEGSLVPILEAVLDKPLTVKIPRTPIPRDNPAVTLCDRPDGCDATLTVIPGTVSIRRLPADNSGKSRLVAQARVEVLADEVVLIPADPDHPERDCRVDLAVKDHYPDVCRSPGVSWARDSNIYNPSDPTWTQTKNDCDESCAGAPNPGRAVGVAIVISVDPALGYPRVEVENLTFQVKASQYCPALNDLRVTQPNRELGAPCADGTTACALFDSSILAEAPGTCLGLNLGYDVAAGILMDAVVAGARIALNGKLNGVLAVPCLSDADCQPGATCSTATVSEGFGCDADGCLLDPKQAQVCNVAGQIVPPLAGFERQLDMNAISERYNPNTTGAMKLLAGIGGFLATDPVAVETQRGLTIGGFFGVETERAPCVAARPRPTIRAIAPLITASPVALFDPAENKAVSKDYHAAISLHADALNQLAWAMYTNGALCVSVNSNDSEKQPTLNSGVLQFMFPSLRQVFGKDVHPTLMQITPGEVPQFSIGRGELETVDGVRIVKSPHAELDMRKIRIELYGQVRERFVRLFSLEASFKVGVFFEFSSDNKLLPLATDIREGLGAINVADVEIMGEPLDKLQDQVPGLLDFALPLLAKAILKDYPLPAPTLMPGYELKMLGLSGSRQIGTTDTYEFLSAFGELQPVSDSAAARQSRSAPRAAVLLTDTADSTAFSAPRVRFQLSSDSGEPVEYSYRLNGGLWTTFSTSSDLVLQREQLRVPMTHMLEVRARRAGDTRHIGDTATLHFTTDAVQMVADSGQEAVPQRSGCAAAPAPWWLLLLSLPRWRRRRTTASGH